MRSPGVLVLLMLLRGEPAIRASVMLALVVHILLFDLYVFRVHVHIICVR
jgi:hypothetical protein